LVSYSKWPRLTLPPRRQLIRLGRKRPRLLEVHESDPVFELTFTQLVDRQPAALSQMYLGSAASPLLTSLLTVESPPAILVEDDGDALDQLARRYKVRPGSHKSPWR
jgi:hypothetical protein